MTVVPKWTKYLRYWITLQSDNEDDTEKLMNELDRKIIAPEEIELSENPGNASVLTPETNAHIADEGTTHTKELETKKEECIHERVVFVNAQLPTNLTKLS